MNGIAITAALTTFCGRSTPRSADRKRAGLSDKTAATSTGDTAATMKGRGHQDRGPTANRTRKRKAAGRQSPRKERSSLAEPLHHRVKRVNHDKREHEPRLDQISALVGLPQVVNGYPEQKDDHRAFDLIQLPARAVSGLPVQIPCNHKNNGVAMVEMKVKNRGSSDSHNRNDRCCRW